MSRHCIYLGQISRDSISLHARFRKHFLELHKLASAIRNNLDQPVDLRRRSGVLPLTAINFTSERCPSFSHADTDTGGCP
jgi:hypothetical protein